MDDPSSSRFARFVSIAVVGTILLSVTALVVESMPQYQEGYDDTFFVIELVSVMVFTMEYLLRLLSCPYSKWLFIKQPLNIVDVVAIFPFYLEVALGSLTSVSTTSLRVVRLVRVFRMFKISRYMTWLRVFYATIKTSAAPLGMIMFVFGIVVVVFSSIVYYAERGTWDENMRLYLTADGEESPFLSIPASFWWCIITMTTIGFGDVVPVTTLGKLVAAAASVTGVLMLAIPISVITASFATEHSKATKTMRIRLELESKVKEMAEVEGTMDPNQVSLWYLRSWLGLIKGNRHRLQVSLKQVELQSREVLSNETGNLVDDLSSKVTPEQRFVKRVLLHRRTHESQMETPPRVVF